MEFEEFWDQGVFMVWGLGVEGWGLRFIGFGVGICRAEV